MMPEVESLRMQVDYLRRQVAAYWDLVEAGRRVTEIQARIIRSQDEELFRYRKGTKTT